MQIYDTDDTLYLLIYDTDFYYMYEINPDLYEVFDGCPGDEPPTNPYYGIFEFIYASEASCGEYPGATPPPIDLPPESTAYGVYKVDPHLWPKVKDDITQIKLSR